MKNGMRRGRRTYSIYVTAAMIACAGFTLYLAWGHARQDFYRRQIPAEVDVADVVDIDGETGVRGGCGAAIFELAAPAKIRLGRLGIRALTKSTVARTDTVDPFAHAVWRETPYLEGAAPLPLENFWAVGLGCTNISANLKHTIDHALRRPGAYFTLLKGRGVLVMPSAGLVAYVYFD
jgi:hypothetical protein